MDLGAVRSADNHSPGLAVNSREPVAPAELAVLRRCHPVFDAGPMRSLLDDRLRARRQSSVPASVVGVSPRPTKPMSRGWSCQRSQVSSGSPALSNRSRVAAVTPAWNLRPQVGGRLDAVVDLFLDRAAEPRHRQVRDVMRFDVLNDRTVSGADNRSGCRTCLAGTAYR